MVSGIATLLCFQLAGEMLVRLGQLPLSGPLCGMIALLLWLHLRGHINEELGRVCGGVLANMALLFVPAGVGALRYAEVFVTHWHAIAPAIVLSACASLLTTAFTARILISWRGPRPLEAGEPLTRATGH